MDQTRGLMQVLALNWRAVTAFVMAAVQLATATGLLPVGSEETANTLIGTAGLVIATIAGGSYFQNIATARQQAASAEAVAQVAPALNTAVAAAATAPQQVAGVAESLQALRAEVAELRGNLTAAPR